MDTASNSTLENEFGTHKDDECIAMILEKGQAQLTQVWIVEWDVRSLDTDYCFAQTHERGGDRNDTKGGRQAH